MKKIVSIILATTLLLGTIVMPTIAVNEPEIVIQNFQSNQYAPRAITITPTIERARTKILNAMIDLRRSVNILEFNIPVAQMADLFFGILYENPQIFYLQTGYSGSSSGGKINEYIFTYTVDKALIPNMKTKFNAKTDEALTTLIKPTMNEFEKALVLHDYISKTNIYDSKNGNNIYTAYGAMVDKKAVCQGYAFAYNHLLKLAGLKSAYVSSESMGHGWNYVQIDGQWYHVDATWDDPNIQIGREFGDMRENGDLRNMVKHTFFLKSDDKMQNYIGVTPHTGWATITYNGEIVTATSTKYDDYWINEVRTPMAYKDGFLYYGEVLNNKLNLVKSKFDGTQKSIITTANYVHNSNPYVPLIDYVDDHVIYIDGNKIMSAKLDGSEAKEQVRFISDQDKNYIEEFYVDNNILYYVEVAGATFANKQVELDYTAAVDVAIQEATISGVVLPARGETPSSATVASNANYTVTSTAWKKGTAAHTGAFAYNTAYTVKIVLTPKTGYMFDSNTTIPQGYTKEVATDGSNITLTKTFPKTSYITGDMNGDDKIELLDALLALKYDAGIIPRDTLASDMRAGDVMRNFIKQ